MISIIIQYIENCIISQFPFPRAGKEFTLYNIYHGCLESACRVFELDQPFSPKWIPKALHLTIYKQGRPHLRGPVKSAELQGTIWTDWTISSLMQFLRQTNLKVNSARLSCGNYQSKESGLRKRLVVQAGIFITPITMAQ